MPIEFFHKGSEAEVKIVNQIQNIVCLLPNFQPISLDFFRQRELLTCQVSICQKLN